MLWSDFDKITMKQLKVLIKRRLEHDQVNSELRSFEHYNAYINIHRGKNDPYKKVHPELEGQGGEGELKSDKPDASAALAMLKEVGVDVDSVSS